MQQANATSCLRSCMWLPVTLNAGAGLKQPTCAPQQHTVSKQLKKAMQLQQQQQQQPGLQQLDRTKAAATAQR